MKFGVIFDSTSLEISLSGCIGDGFFLCIFSGKYTNVWSTVIHRVGPKSWPWQNPMT